MVLSVARRVPVNSHLKPKKVFTVRKSSISEWINPITLSDHESHPAGPERDELLVLFLKHRDEKMKLSFTSSRCCCGRKSMNPRLSGSLRLQSGLGLVRSFHLTSDSSHAYRLLSGATCWYPRLCGVASFSICLHSFSPGHPIIQDYLQ